MHFGGLPFKIHSLSNVKLQIFINSDHHILYHRPQETTLLMLNFVPSDQYLFIIISLPQSWVLIILYHISMTFPSSGSHRQVIPGNICFSGPGVA